MDTVTSRDGTPIAFRRSGEGPFLVLVHGAGGSHARWSGFAQRLQPYFTILAIDRRGRGRSGDAPDYDIKQEFADVAAVVDSLGGPAVLFGHSYGAICALEAALLTRNVAKLILYEPPIFAPAEREGSEELPARLEAMLAAGDRAGAVRTFLAESVRMPPHELDMAQASPAWHARVAAAHTLPREMRARNAYRFDASRFAGLEIPALLLLGGDSPPFFKKAVRTLEAGLPNVRTSILAGQQHVAMDTAPDVLMREVLAFCAA